MPREKPKCHVCGADNNLYIDREYVCWDCINPISRNPISLHYTHICDTCGAKAAQWSLADLSSLDPEDQKQIMCMVCFAEGDIDETH